MGDWSDIWSGSDLVSGGDWWDFGTNDTAFDTGYDWGSLWGGDSGGGGGGTNWWSTIGNWLGGSDGAGGTNASNIFGAMLGGLGGAAEAFMSEENIEAMGREQRRTLDFTAQLEDYYGQKDKARKRTALDTYGQFSLMDRWAPNYVDTPPVQVPTKPGA